MKCVLCDEHTTDTHLCGRCQVDVPFLLGIAYGTCRERLPDIAGRAQAVIDGISRRTLRGAWPARVGESAPLLRRAIGVVSDVARLQGEAAAVLDAYARPTHDHDPGADGFGRGGVG